MTTAAEKAQPTKPVSLRAWAVLFLILPAFFGWLYLWSQHVPPFRPDPPDPEPELIILQLNDTYSLGPVRVADGHDEGGFGRVAALVRQLKQQKRPVLVLHAGDFLAPSLESKHLGAAPMVDALNYLQDLAPVYVTPGNHEFDEEEPELLAEALGRSRFGWVLSNLRRDERGVNPELARRAPASVVRTFGKLKVGIFALTIASAHGGRDRFYAPLTADYGAAAEVEIKRLEEQGADLVVGLTHLDMPDDIVLSRLKQKHPRFQWIAGGHEHYWQSEAASADTALITKGGSNARTVWKVSVLLKDGQPILREERVDLKDDLPKPDEKFQRVVAEQYRARLLQKRPHLDRAIAKAPEGCYHGSEDVVREVQSDWGSLIADGMRRAYINVPADIAVINGGSVRIDANICGPVTFEHIERSLLFESPVTYVKLKGKHLKEQLLEHSVAGKLGDGRFLQVSGVRFRFDRDRRDGERVWDVKVQTKKGWEPLRVGQPYVIAVPQYLFDCGDSYDFRKNVEEYIPLGPDLRSLAYAVLAGHNAPGRSANPAPEARINGVPKYAEAPSARRGIWVRAAAADRVCAE